MRDQTGRWDAAGQTRTVLLAGGGSLQEELTSVDPPRSFGYRLTGVSGPMALLGRPVDGRMGLRPGGGGTEVTWRWTIYRKSPLTAWALPAVRQDLEGLRAAGAGDLSAALTAALR